MTLKAKHFIIYLSAVFVSFFAALPVQALTIDTFDGNVRVEALINNEPVLAAEPSAGAIGGAHCIQAIKSGGAGPATSLRIYGPAGLNGNLYHSQDSQVTGSSRVIWDGDLVVDKLNSQGLKGIDLTQDGGDAFTLKIVSFDFAGNLPIEVGLEIYDGGDTSGSKFSQRFFTLNSTITDQTITIPFADFKPAGLLGGASFRNVGAIVLRINGNSPSSDLTLDSLGTNGKCDLVPDSSGRVIDDCGVCGGHNEQKDQCGVCFGQNRDLDRCGVCFGNNRQVDDCGVCFGNNQAKDICGVCGGDGGSCKDCAGVPNGSAAIDACGVCAGDGRSCLDCKGVPFGVTALDLCGVCGGDGKTCIKCTKVSFTELLAQLAEKSKAQQQMANFFITGLKKWDRALAGKNRREVTRLYNELLAGIQKIDPESLECTGPLNCVDSFENETILLSYRQRATDLYKLSRKILDIIKKKGSGGKCRGPVAECVKRVRERGAASTTLTRDARQLLQQNINLTLKVPRRISRCD